MELNTQQKAAVEAPRGPLLIVAGAGTGKTRTLTSRLMHFIEEGTKPQRICAITFTNKAAKEMAERISDLKNPNSIRMTRKNNSGRSDVFVDSGRGQPFIGTFHALGARILRKECRLLGRKPNFVIFDDHDSFDLIKKITKKLLPPGKSDKADGGKRERDERPAYFAEKISEIKNLNDALQKLTGSEKEKDKLALKIFKLYEKRLQENNAFDFDDLIEKVVFLFRRYPEVLQKYQKKFDAILVDEYQDLNPAQYELVKFLAGGHRNLSVVGDDEQMIYGWRYADLKTFLDFERDWPGARIAFLEENYRSTANIVGAATAVAANNVYRRPKNLWTKNEAGARIKICELDDEDEEAEWIANTISNFQFSIFKKNGEGESTAVLYRTNAQSRAIEQALINKQISYKIFGGVKFYERKEIKDIVAAMRLAANKSDEISRDRLEKNLSKRKFSELWEKISDPKAGTAAPVKLINIFLKATAYVEYLEKNYFNYDERKENISELVNFASRYDNLPQFLEEIALVQPTDVPSASDKEPAYAKASVGRQATSDKEKPVSSNRLPVASLMTIHLAKGLEFDDVFIAGGTEGLLPHARSMENEYQLEEERRLMYVAMTRTKKNLHISFYDTPSRFLSEIPTEFTELENKIGGSSPPDDEENFISYD